jgi:hypothetical protein
MIVFYSMRIDTIFHFATAAVDQSSARRRARSSVDSHNFNFFVDFFANVILYKSFYRQIKEGA